MAPTRFLQRLFRPAITNMLKSIITEIRKNFRKFGCFDESIFKTEMKMASLLIREAEIISFEMKSQGVVDEIIDTVSNQAPSWKFLVKNISIDSANKTIDYDSLIHNFNEIVFILKKVPSLDSSVRLYKLRSLLWAYLYHIHEANCNMIFNIRHYNTGIICLILELRSGFFDNLSSDKEILYNLGLYLEKLYKNGKLQCTPIVKLLKKWSLQFYCKYVKVPKKVSSFFEMSLFSRKRQSQYNAPPNKLECQSACRT